ncbi:MAG TPA: cardiolipin synthase, partial [Desulfobacteraceae bacterium]|nr:cardiolipin synthase [Desulfobacteraceae bacterium]
MSRVRMLTIFYLLFQVLGLFSSVHAILYARTAQGAIAWVVSLNVMPIIAVPAYWVFGRSKFHGYVNALKDTNLVIQEDKIKIHEEFKPFIIHQPEDFPEYLVVRKLSTTPFLRGNRVQLLIDGEATYDSLEKGIKQAQSYILFQFYILQSDETGERFRKLLVDKAGDGVAVYVLYDELGSQRISQNSLQELRASGIHIVPFNTTQGTSNRFQLNFRNHRKIMVVDGKEAWIGGLNIGDEYLGKHKKLSPWRDTHIRIEGPAALVTQSIFWSDWYWADQKLLEDLDWRPQAASGVSADGGQDVLVLGSGPADELETASLFFTTVLNSAINRIWIATPYFIPDEATQVALYLALLKGLDVRILTPRLNDNWFVSNAANVYLSDLSRIGAKIYFYDQGFMHQKVVLIDDNLALVGTVNFD